jgi:hypothetical protein
LSGSSYALLEQDFGGQVIARVAESTQYSVLCTQYSVLVVGELGSRNEKHFPLVPPGDLLPIGAVATAEGFGILAVDR